MINNVPRKLSPDFSLDSGGYYGLFTTKFAQPILNPIIVQQMPQSHWKSRRILDFRVARRSSISPSLRQLHQTKASAFGEGYRLFS